MKFICVDLVLKRLALAVGGTIDRRLYDYLRGAILDGSRHQGRAAGLARLGARGRDVVQHRAARYEQLRAEGYVHSRVGGGTFVAAIRRRAC